jgi:hypothetical protein
MAISWAELSWQRCEKIIKGKNGLHSSAALKTSDYDRTLDDLPQREAT